MTRQKLKYLSLIYILSLNNIHYELKSKYFKLSLHIPSLNICIDKYYFGSYFYIYVEGKFKKKIKEQDFIDKFNLLQCEKKFNLKML